ncbi:type I-E CRISPR-associated protein Cas7/Cse4/CasC [Thiocapsa rosea]|uniref:CRISPR system Cascade subunit CasC n=1 Tax=Thiocapsa rosea TaxID=69360 RepID=A0A495VGM5_9GAMM|nr:type I-E CRISPR-associated protein Cas7/Cse4/CasC [Thiocapsa rosea]RKT47595.1 CRISPR system Cascade subunit CasC [Thiocapsa rosea]
MSTFLQLHLLTSYPPACLNRDDLNRPKSAIMGGVPRLRISSQSLKRAWRASEQFEDALTGHLGTRTKRRGVKIFEKLAAAGIREKEAKEWAQAIAGRFGKLKAKKENEPRNDLEIEQLAHFSPEEEVAIDALADVLISEGRAPTEPELALLRKQHTAADIALFGRMLADNPAFNTEAACQVAHAITVHRAAVEDDFFTAVDDLNNHEEDAGSAHMGEQGFGAGLFYQYVCIDCDRLHENLGGDAGLASRTIQALIEAAATVAPTGKQNSFASRACAYYVLAEKGSRQPRSLSLAFMKPVREGDMLDSAVNVLTSMRNNLDKVYFQSKPLASRSINAIAGEGDFTALKTWAAQVGDDA